MSQYHRYNNTVAAVAAGNTSWSAVNSNDNNIHGYKAYIESPSSDWLLNTPRKVLMQYGCPKCCEENYKRRLAVTNNQDGTYTSHFVYCSITCVLFNKQQLYFAYQFNRSGDLGSKGGKELEGLMDHVVNPPPGFMERGFPGPSEVATPRGFPGPSELAGYGGATPRN